MTGHNQFPVPSRYVDSGAVEAFRTCHRALVAWAKDWTGTSGAALLGPTKAGKSTAAALACRRRAKLDTWSETWVRWVRADYLTRLVNERQGADQIHDLKKSRVLVIDEVGYEPWPTALLEVIGDRHDNDRPTLVTSGLRAQAFADRYSDATLRRIIETGNGVLVDCWEK